MQIEPVRYPIQHVSTVFAQPFGKLEQIMVLEGATLQEIVQSHADHLPLRFWQQPYVTIDGEYVEPWRWAEIVPRATKNGVPTIVTLQTSLAGGKGNSSKMQIIGLVAALALTVVTAGIGAGVLGPLGASAGLGTLLAGGIGAKIAAGVVGVLGALAIGALTAPPTASDDGNKGTKDTNKVAASLGGNTLGPGDQIPRPVGTMKVMPPLVCEPLSEIVGDSVTVEAVFALAGPVHLDDIRADNVAMSDIQNVQIETREGWDDDTPLTLITRSGRSRQPGIQLSTHLLSTKNDDLVDIRDRDTPNIDLPIWHQQISFISQDEIWNHFQFPGGLLYINANGDTVQACVPVRMRVRLRGSTTWRNMPEIHFRDNRSGLITVGILMRWAPAPDVLSDPHWRGAGLAYYSTPAQQGAITQPGWLADSYFYRGSGDTWYGNNLGNPNGDSTGVVNVDLKDNTAVFYLDENIWPKGQYEIEVMRGCAIIGGWFGVPNYTIAVPQSGGTSVTVVRDFFYYANKLPGSPFGTAGLQVAVPQKPVAQMTWVQVQCVWNDVHPFPNPGNACFAVKAADQTINNVSVMASGYVPDWDGEDWQEWKYTSNPAPHFRDILVGLHNRRPLPIELLDNQGLVDFRQRCIDDSFEANGLLQGDSVWTILQQLAGSAFAAPYAADVWSTVQDFDRNALSETRVYSPRTMSGLSIKKAFPINTVGFRCSFINALADYTQDEIIVMDDLASEDDEPGTIEQADYPTYVTPGEVIRRAKFDLRQARLRSKQYSFAVSRNMLALRKGTLVGLAHPIIQDQTGYGRIKQIGLDPDDPTMIVSLVLDSKVRVVAIPDTDDSDGVRTAIAISRIDGSYTTQYLVSTNGWDYEVDLETPMVDDGTIQAGCSFSTGTTQEIYRRLVVQSMEPGQDLSSTLNLVEEANDIFGDAAHTSINTGTLQNALPTGWSLHKVA